MRIAITGEKGFIARNLAKEIERQGHEFVSLDNSLWASKCMVYTESNEVCVHKNTIDAWEMLFKNLNLDVIVHNAALVGTDVVALNPFESISTNILGTKKITEAANRTNLLNVFMGTTVIYDTYEYQESEITESSKIYPRTDYAIQKYAGEMIVRNNADKWLVTRPLFAYGGIGDMNSLISKSLYAIKNEIKNVDMFLDPRKIKDYMHVEDFCYSVVKLINSDITNEDFNITAANPYNTLEITKMIEAVTGQPLDKYIKWYPETDYLGNHRLSNKKYQDHMGFTKSRFLKQGIKDAWDSINNNDTQFNPLKHLDEAKEKNIDLTSFFPKR